MKQITHVIFDVDGLLLDTETIYTEFLTQFCAKYNCQFTYELKRKMMGRKPHESAQLLIDELSLPITVAEYLSEKRIYLSSERWHTVKWMPGAERLISHLASHGIPMAAATGCCSNEVADKAYNHQKVWSLLSHVVASGDDPEVKHGKPMPDIFQIAAGRFENPPKDPSHALVFEDAPNGVKGGLAAGMQVVWIPDENENLDVFPEPLTPDEDSRLTRLKSLTKFCPEQFGLPPFA